MAYLSLADTPCDAARRQVEKRYAVAASEITRALEAFGYYRATIETSLAFDDACWRAAIDVAAGQPVVIRSFEFTLEGAARTDSEFERITSSAPLAGGVVFEHQTYELYKRDLRSLAAARGYFDARFREHRVSVDPEEGVADIVLVFSSGNRYRLGQVSYEPSLLSPALLAAYYDFEPGEPYTAVAITSLHRALSSSGYFRSVSISADPATAQGDLIPVVVRVTPANRRAYQAGGGFATDVGPRVRADYRHRRVNRRGDQLEAETLYSPVQSAARLRYRRPRRDPRYEWLIIELVGEFEDTDTSEWEAYTLRLRRTNRRYGEWIETRYVEISHESFDISDQDDSTTLVTPGLSLDLTKTELVMRPLTARSIHLEMSGTDDVLGSNTSYLQLRAAGKWVRPLTENWRLISRIDAGVTFKDSLRELPPSVRFFAGGDNSVRGYEFESLGTRDAAGEVIGGTRLLTASLEVDRLITPKWSLAAFVDTGAAFGDEDPDFSTGVGIGIRRLTPVGPVRIDFAHPLDDEDRSVRVHISLGRGL